MYRNNHYIIIDNIHFYSNVIITSNDLGSEIYKYFDVYNHNSTGNISEYLFFFEV